MRFTPTAFLGSSLGVELVATANGSTSGSFTSGGIDYAYLQFPTGTTTLDVSSGANVDILLVAGGAGGFTGSLDAGKGGGGGGVSVVSTRLLRGTYSINVGAGGTSNEKGEPTSIASYGLNYYVSGGFADGTSGYPQFNTPGTDSGNCGGGNTAAGGGGGAFQTGSSAFCPPSNIPNGANGGEGLTYNFNGTPSVYGSGGGGGAASAPFAQGGLGGTNAGNGASYNTFATNATNGFGGGGGGERDGNPQQSGTGGSGTLIIRYQIP